MKEKISGKPKIAIILGSGLGNLVKSVELISEIPYSEIPFFSVSAVEGHKGTLLFGRLNGVEVVILNGRTHYYEGHSMQAITFPIYVLQAIGIQQLILSNAAGGMNPSFKVGDIMLINDHINFFGDNPLIGENDERLGARFVSMDSAYSPRLLRIAEEVAKREAIPHQKGVYVAVSGPNFESAAECKAFYILGGDAIGMSTIPETIVARYLKIEVFALSAITDLAIIGEMEETSHEAVLQAAAIAGKKMEKLVFNMMPLL